MHTIKEYLDEAPKKAFLYMPELLDHLLKARTDDSLYKCPFDGEIFRQELREAMKTRTLDHKDLDAELDTFETHRRHREKDADTGNIDVERYIDGDPRPFVDVFTETTPKPSKTILLDIAISAFERHQNEAMRNRHRHVYHEAIKAESEGSPLRVIGVFSINIPERPEALTLYIIIKDYSDPIFPELWGTVKTNQTANSAINVIMDYLIGTSSDFNGFLTTTDTTGDFPEDEELIIIDSPRIKAPNARTIDTNDPTCYAW